MSRIFELNDGLLQNTIKYLLIQTLQETKGNKTHAAKILGISVRTMRNWCHRFKLTEYIYPYYPPIVKKK